jgi:hypothetical protein
VRYKRGLDNVKPAAIANTLFYYRAQFFGRCFVLMLCASCFELKITSFGHNWLLCAHALCFMLGRARQKDPIFVSRSVCLLLLAISSVRMIRAWQAVTKKTDKHKA